MGPVSVVEVLVLLQHDHQVPPVPDQGAVQHLPPAAADPPFHDRIHSRRLDRGAYDPDARGLEHGIERQREAGVPVVQHELHPRPGFSRSMSRFLACCTTKDWTGCPVAPRTRTRRVPRADERDPPAFGRDRPVAGLGPAGAAAPMRGPGGRAAGRDQQRPRRDGGRGASRWIRQEIANATENAVLRASSGPDRRVHSSTYRQGGWRHCAAPVGGGAGALSRSFSSGWPCCHARGGRSGRPGRNARYARISTDHRRTAERGAPDERVHREPED